MLVASDLDKKASTKWYMVNIGILGIPKKFCDGGPDPDKGTVYRIYSQLSAREFKYLISDKVLEVCAKKAVEYMIENDILDKSEIPDQFQKDF